MLERTTPSSVRVFEFILLYFCIFVLLYFCMNVDQELGIPYYKLRYSFTDMQPYSLTFAVKYFYFPKVYKVTSSINRCCKPVIKSKLISVYFLA